MQRNLYDRLNINLKRHIRFNIYNNRHHQDVVYTLMDNDTRIEEPGVNDVFYYNYLSGVAAGRFRGCEIFAKK